MKNHASSSCSWVAFTLLGISWEQLGIWCRPLKSKTPWSVSMEKHTGLYLGRITMQCYMHTLWCMDPCSQTLDMECMLMIASIVHLLIDALSQNDVSRENTSACADVTPLTMAEFNKTCTSPTTKLWLMYMDMVMILKRYIHAARAGLWEEYLAELENMLLYLVSAGRYKYVSACLTT